MAIRTRAVAILTVSTFLGGMVSVSRAEEFQTLNYTFTAEGPVEILNGWKCWFGPPRCGFAECHMTTIRQPTLGRLKLRVRQTTIQGSNAGLCAGRRIAGLFMTYAPRPGAHGVDTVVLRSVADNGGRHILNFSITIP